MIGKDVELIEYSEKVDLANCLTHALGAVLSAAGLVMLLFKAQGARETVSAVIYGLSLIAVYTVSAVYHGLPRGEAKRRARLADHSTIPTLIAGTATPCALLTLYQISVPLGLIVLILAWFCAVFGFISKMFFFEKLKAVTMAVYIISCAVMLLSAVPVLGSIDKTAFAGLVLGCVLYLIGAILCGLGKKRPRLHIIFHIFVLLGSIAHFAVIYKFVL
ncbi:MAG: hemolysin III family protein [Acutalibacteraceae bacterium]